MGAQLILNKFQVYKILCIQIKVTEKKENNAKNRNQNVYFHIAFATVKQKMTLRLFSPFKGEYLCLLPETNFKISHANCISNTPIIFRCHVLNGS